MFKKFIIGLLVSTAVFGFTLSPAASKIIKSSNEVHAANWDKRKTVTTKLSASDIKKKIKNASLTEAVTGPFAAMASAGLGSMAKSVFGKVGVAGVVSTTATIMNQAAKAEKAKLQGYLDKIKKGKAKGIKITQVYAYGYMNGSGNTWVAYGRPTFALY
ncbi:hypothetical protein [Listeria booriae]|uniref:hypothetical protein n=1 Tax=Listeria booriae TaxID=1552123 RepID=UPI00162AB98C|nr:hypothetical protein [Listeria booriae]MBC2170100.1 hypothetical protein [Listeria booriae]MBC2195177.1 hypothetical protein [Listeria booriae]